MRMDCLNVPARELGLDLPLAREGWGGGVSAIEVSMNRRQGNALSVPS
ncbi:MAG: hypothetical protein V7634_1246, partial [Bradyrhizobium sp.]